MRKTQPISITDLYRFKIPREPKVSPDGKRVVFTVERMHKQDKTYYTNLYVTGTIGRGLKQLTFGKRNDHSPVWSPNGEQIVFISKRETASQIWRLAMDGDKDLFVHMNDIKMEGFKTLKERQEVDFEVGVSDKGSCAKNVIPK